MSSTTLNVVEVEHTIVDESTKPMVLATPQQGNELSQL